MQADRNKGDLGSARHHPQVEAGRGVVQLSKPYGAASRLGLRKRATLRNTLFALRSNGATSPSHRLRAMSFDRLNKDAPATCAH
jgi:hypothetical protein